MVIRRLTYLTVTVSLRVMLTYIYAYTIYLYVDEVSTCELCLVKNAHA